MRKLCLARAAGYEQEVVLTFILAALALLSFGLTLWQWDVGRRFSLHERIADRSFAPGVTLLKPLKGCDDETEGCLRSWFEQEYPGPVQILFGVADPEDRVCALVEELIAAYPKRDATLLICAEQLGPNAKVSTLVQLQGRAAFDLSVISDADVWAPADLLVNVIAPLRDGAVGLVNCFYQLAHRPGLAMEWEAVAANADFWSQVLQSRSLKPLDFALGAVMATRRAQLKSIGGFEALLDFLADDYQLGRRIAGNGARIELCPVVAECRSAPMSWRAVWAHQLRWARTIRVCQPTPFFFSILSNGTFWPLLWMAVDRRPLSLALTLAFLTVRVLTASSNYRRLTRHSLPWHGTFLVFMKDILGVATWALAFAGNHVDWRGRRYRLRPDGHLELEQSPGPGERSRYCL